MQPTGRRPTRVSVQGPGIKVTDTVTNSVTGTSVVSGTAVTGVGGDGTSKEVPQMCEQTKMLYLSVSTGRAFPYVAQWMHEKASEMESTVERLTHADAKATLAAIDAKHEAVKAARRGHEKGRLKLMAELQMLQAVHNHQQTAGNAWLEAYKATVEACMAEMLAMKAELLARKAGVAEWCRGGGRERVLNKLNALKARHAVLQNRSERTVVREGLRREQSLQRMRETMDTLVGEVSEAVTWDMHQRLHGSLPVFGNASQRNGSQQVDEDDDDVWLAETEDERVVRLEEAKLSEQLLNMRRQRSLRRRRKEQKRRQRLLKKGDPHATNGENVDGEKYDDVKNAVTVPNEEKTSWAHKLPTLSKSEPSPLSVASPQYRGNVGSTTSHEDVAPVSHLSLPSMKNRSGVAVTNANAEGVGSGPTETKSASKIGNGDDEQPVAGDNAGESTQRCRASVKNRPFVLFDEKSEKGLVGSAASPDRPCKQTIPSGVEESGNYNNMGNKCSPAVQSKIASGSLARRVSVASRVGKESISAIKRPPIILPPTISGNSVGQLYNADHIAALLSALSEDKAHFAASKKSTKKEVQELRRKLQEHREETARLFDNNVSLERQRAQLVAQREAQLIKLSACKENQVTERAIRSNDTELLDEGLACTLDVVKEGTSQRLAEVAQVRKAIDAFNAEIAERERKVQIVREYWRRNSKAFMSSDRRPSTVFGATVSSGLTVPSNNETPSPELVKSSTPTSRGHAGPGVQFSPKWPLALRRCFHSHGASSCTLSGSGAEWVPPVQNSIPALGLNGFDVVSRFIQDLFDEIPLSDVPERLFIGHTR